MSKTEKSQSRQQQDSEVKLKVVEWVERLSAHFGSPQDDEQIKIFVHALERNTEYQINGAFERCLNECMFMPKLADVHSRMPEQKYATENPGRFVLDGRPVLDLVREIAIEMHPDYASITDGQRIKEIFHEANRERYRRMGINPDSWRGRKQA